MTDIYIKSFNRPYYLEKCIRSIHLNVEGSYRITVIDDGTALEYLGRISELFPEIRIIKSPLHNEKITAIKEHLSGKKKFHQPVLPVETWKDTVKAGSDYFLMLEDDNWIIAPLNIEETASVMKKERFAMLTIDWQGNEKFINGRKRIIDDNIEETIPDIPLATRIIWLNQEKYNCILPFLRKTKIESLLCRVGFLKDEYETKWPLYTLCLFTSTFFEKNYWLYLWDGASSTWNEHYQLKRACLYYSKNKSRYAKTRNQLAHTTYLSSATNNYNEISLDVYFFNHIINQEWLKGQFDPMENYPGEFSLEYVKKFLDNNPKSSFDNWLKWIDRFKTQYRSIGCVVDF